MISSLVWNPKGKHCDASEQERLLDAVSLGPVNVMSILSSWAAEFRKLMIKTEAEAARAPARKRKPSVEPIPKPPRVTRSRTGAKPPKAAAE
jgi:hypothetical protein